MTEPSDSEIVSTRQRRIAQLAKQMPEKGLTSLTQLMDIDWLTEAYRRTRKDGAVGVDGQTAADYETGPGGQPPVAPGTREVGHVPGAAGATGAYPERRLETKPAPSAFPRWRTKCSSGRSSCCWSRSTSRTFSTARMGSGRGDRRTRP